MDASGLSLFSADLVDSLATRLFYKQNQRFLSSEQLKAFHNPPHGFSGYLEAANMEEDPVRCARQHVWVPGDLAISCVYLSRLAWMCTQGGQVPKTKGEA